MGWTHLVRAACWYHYSLPHPLVNAVAFYTMGLPQFQPQFIGDEDLLAMDRVVDLPLGKLGAEKLPDRVTVLCTEEVPSSAARFAIGKGLSMHKNVERISHVHMQPG